MQHLQNAARIVYDKSRWQKTLIINVDFTSASAEFEYREADLKYKGIKELMHFVAEELFIFSTKTTLSLFPSLWTW
mgnify:FL=1